MVGSVSKPTSLCISIPFQLWNSEGKNATTKLSLIEISIIFSFYPLLAIDDQCNSLKTNPIREIIHVIFFLFLRQ